VNRQQIGQLLTEAALIDNRAITPALVQIWHKYLEPFEYADAVAALDWHRINSTEYLVPAHITAGIRRIRAERLAHTPTPPPAPEIAADAKRGLSTLRQAVKAIGDGLFARKLAALPPGERRPGPPPEEFARVRASMRPPTVRPTAPAPPAPDLSSYEPARALLAELGPSTAAALIAQAQAALGDETPAHLLVIHAADLARRTT
jgi:hypothetical protein